MSSRRHQDESGRLQVVEEESSSSAPTAGDGGVENSEENGQHADRGRPQLSLEELMYSAASYHAIAKPVTLTMVLSSLAVVYINTEESREETQEQLTNTYTVFDTTNSSSDSQTLGLSLVNALIIVSVVCAMTFVIVLLYKYKCMKVLMGYMVIASATLLGVLGGTMFEVAIDKYDLAIDKISFYFTMWNFALVGTVCIFFARGVPVFATQGYLIATSVILAWQLAHFDAWTSWTLLVMLALYDLCAVLTPCGPLKWLVKLMTKDDSPGVLPGLLYEAQLPADARRPGRQEANNNNNEEENEQRRQRRIRRRRARRSDTEPTVEESSVATTIRSDSGLSSTVLRRDSTATSESSFRVSNDNGDSTAAPQESSPGEDSAVFSSLPKVDEQGFPLPREEPPIPRVESDSTNGSNGDAPPPANGDAPPPANGDAPPPANGDAPPPTGMIPLAIAKLYRLRLVNPVEPARDDSQQEPLSEEEEQNAEPNVILARLYTPAQLKSRVEAIFPRNGGRIDCEFPSNRQEEGEDSTVGLRYIVRDRHGVVKRRLLVDEEGKIYEEQARSERADESPSDNTIKLGLGDFIFYSILVATAALYSFTTFAACTLVVLAGLGSTLILLAVYHHALPALPISIMLGVIFYLLTRTSIEPWIEDIFRNAYYV